MKQSANPNNQKFIEEILNEEVMNELQNKSYSEYFFKKKHQLK